MATLYIAEYRDPRSFQELAGVVKAPAIAEQTVAIGGASTQSAAFNTSTAVIRVHVDAICSIAMGSNPTATTSKKRMAADQTEYFGVSPGDKLAVIANT